MDWIVSEVGDRTEDAELLGEVSLNSEVRFDHKSPLIKIASPAAIGKKDRLLLPRRRDTVEPDESLRHFVTESARTPADA